MIEEIDLFGVFLPSLFVWMILAFLATMLLRRLLSATGAYRFIWHRPLFDLALYVVTLGTVIWTASYLA